MEDFDYKTPPYEWQKEFLALSHREPNCAALADMGTGKSKALVDALRLRYKIAKRLKKTLVVSPLVTLYNWKNEFAKQSNIPPERVHVLTGASAKKLKQLAKAIEHNPLQIVIVNYECLLMVRDKVKKKKLLPCAMLQALLDWQPEEVVLDEAHYVKNHKAARSKGAELVCASANRMISTGTLITKGIEDLFMPYKIMDGGDTFGDNFYTYQRTYMYDENARWAGNFNYFPKWVVREEKYEELSEKLYRKAIRVMKEDCVDLPPFVQEIYPVELSPRQRKLYDEMERDYITYIDTHQGVRTPAVASTALVKSLRLQQIVSGFVKLDDGTEVEIDECPRMDALEELILSLQVGNKIIIWCAFKKNIEMISRMLTKHKVKFVTITGDDDLEAKQAAMDALQNDPETRVSLNNRKAGGIGVNLVAASFSIVYSRDYDLEKELQSRDRNFRGGSNIHEKVTKIDLCAVDTVDEGVTENLVAKKEVADRVIDFARQRRNRAS